MTPPAPPRRLQNDAVEVTLGSGSYTLRWPGTQTTLGPCRAAIVAGEGENSSTGPGSWDVTPGTAYGRAGTWARWRSEHGRLAMSLHLPSSGPVVVLEIEGTFDSETTLDRIVALDGVTDLVYDRRLVDGYDSWAYSGVRGAEGGASFWNTAFVSPDGRALAVQTLGADRLCTRITNDGSRIRVECGAPPALEKVPGTWGYLTTAPRPLGIPVLLDDVVCSAPIAVASTDDAMTLVEDLAMLVAQSMHARRWTGPPPNGWESWYQYGLLVSEHDVRANARALKERYGHRPGFDLVQIDDGWQRTYGAWWPNERFPEDLADLVRELHDLDCRAGLWIAPFRVQPGGPGIASEHSDWCLRDPDGAPLLEDRHGTWSLDASNPAVVEWLRELGATVRGWGFEMVKVDFCYLAASDGVRADGRCTGIEALRRGMAALVDGLGEDVYVLGCGMPILPAIGVCHGNRVGHDLAMPRVHQPLGHPLDEGWTGFAGVRAQARNVAARWAHAGRWYDADPEVVMAWGSDGGDPAGYSTDEARALATMVAVCGGPFLLADDLAALTPSERRVIEEPALLDLIRCSRFRPVDLLDRCDDATVPEHAYAQSSTIPRVWIAERDGTRVLAVFNWDDEPIHIPVPDAFNRATDVWTGVSANADQPLAPRSVRLFRA